VDEDEEEENLTLTSKKGARGKKGPASRGGATSGRPKKDLSHIQCYVCGEFGHYASQCSQAKKGKGAKGRKQGGSGCFRKRIRMRKRSNSWLPQLASFPGCSRMSIHSSLTQRIDLEMGGT
jgi:hypothetical protein